MKGGIFLKGDVYYTNVWDGAEKRKIKERVGTDRKAALARAAQIKAGILSLKPNYRPGGGPSPTMSEYLPRFLESNYASEKSRITARRTILRFIAYQGDVRLNEASKGMLGEYIKRRLADRVPHPYRVGEVDPEKVRSWEATAPMVARTTINREIDHLKRILNHACKEDLLEFSPFKKVEKFKGKAINSRRRSEYAQEHEISRLLEAAKVSKNKQFHDIVLLAIYLGRRRGDILSLRRRDYDRRNANLFIRNPKPGHPQWVRVPPAAKRVLERLLDQSTCDWLFPNGKLSGPIKDVDTAWHTAVRRAGLGDLRFHDLKHTAVSHMAMAGLDPRTISQLVGTSMGIIEKIYMQISSKHMISSTETYGRYMDRLVAAGQERFLEPARRE